MTDLAGLLRAIADESRLRLLTTLMRGDATVSELAAQLGLPQPRVSSHLAVLRDVGLVSVQRSGRQRAYHVDAGRIAPVLSALEAVLPGSGVVDERPRTQHPRRSREATTLVAKDAPIRQARTCYDHLAGVAGVRLLDEFLSRGWLQIAQDDSARPQYALTSSGERELEARGVDLAGASAARRMYAFGCLDWTERRPHLGGALGAAILQSLINSGVIERELTGRTARLHMTIDRWLDPTDGS